ncbi:MAG: tRNA (adenosine(37)-N6)-threonylcarbamoyltransferase complex ATPase subunit type 1 TsaE, partial [Actinomycetota bacterium]|nr:tRNA (adenosine(37)-N6)-threonylcarbamoyltransferase complex ATPase subunit type 1 TsaE [Actinomycetota bacterium]
PTFTLVHSYDAGKLTLHHADLYRLDRLAEVADLALDELAERRAVVLVEWGDVAAAMFPDRLEVRLSHVDDDVDARIIRITAVGRRWSTRWSELVAAVERC